MKAKYQTPLIKIRRIGAPTIMAGSNWEGGAKPSNIDFDESTDWDEDM